MEARFARVIAFLISTLIGLTGETFGFTEADVTQLPSGSTSQGSTARVLVGHYLVVKMKTGSGPTLVNHTTVHWVGTGQA